MSELPLTLACGDYEIVSALIDKKVRPDGIDLNVLTEMDFDDAPLALPAQPGIRCRGGVVLVVSHRARPRPAVRRASGFPAPPLSSRLHLHQHAEGHSQPGRSGRRRIGLKQFQSTAIVWLRGILQHEYGVPLESIEWVCELDETLELAGPSRLKVVRLPNDSSVERMLAEGEIDALLHPDLIHPLVEKDPRVARLFPDFRQEEIAYYRKTQIFPIMHVMGIKRSVLERHPWIAINLFHAFDDAKNAAMKRLANPRIVPLAWYREAWEEQEDLLGRDPWQYGLGRQNAMNSRR